MNTPTPLDTRVDDLRRQLLDVDDWNPTASLKAAELADLLAIRATDDVSGRAWRGLDTIARDGRRHAIDGDAATLIERVVANVTTPNNLGLVGPAATFTGTAPYVTDLVVAAPLLAIYGIPYQSGTGTPIVPVWPDLPTVTAQSIEKGELASTTMTVDRSDAVPVSLGIVVDVSAQLDEALRGAGQQGDLVLSLLTAATLAAADQHVADEITTNGTAAADLAAAYTALGTATPSTIAGPVPALLALGNLADLTALGVRVVADNALANVVVTAPAGVIASYHLVTQQVVEPRLFGREVAVAVIVAVTVDPARVAVVA